MPTVTVTKTDQSKNGKPRVYFDGKNDWKDAYYVGNKCPSVPAVGMAIEADTSSMQFPNAKAPTWFLNSWKPAGNGTAAPQASPETKSVSGWAIDAGDCSRLLSNVLASSIAAGLIKTPEDMAPWVDRVYAYVNGVRSGKIVSFDDRIDWPKDEPKTGLAGSIEDGEPPYTADF